MRLKSGEVMSGIQLPRCQERGPTLLALPAAHGHLGRRPRYLCLVRVFGAKVIDYFELTGTNK